MSQTVRGSLYPLYETRYIFCTFLSLFSSQYLRNGMLKISSHQFRHVLDIVACLHRRLSTRSLSCVSIKDYNKKAIEIREIFSRNPFTRSSINCRISRDPLYIYTC